MAARKPIRRPAKKKKMPDMLAIPKAPPIAVISKTPSVTLPPTTTEQEDIVTAGQRKVNLIWEYTQAVVALMVVAANMAAGIYYAFAGKAENIPVVLSSSLFLVIGFYFSRTNHQAIGGVGKKPPLGKYEGR